MANPQIENGYTKIANELLEALCKTRLSDYEHRIVMMIIRKTYGFNKKADWICLKKLSDDTDIKLPHVSRTISKLLNRNIIARKKRLVSIQKDYDKWLPKEVTNKVTQRGNVTQTGNQEKLPKDATKVTQRGNKKLPKQVDTKEKKETIQKKGAKPKKRFLNFVLLTEEENQTLIDKLGKEKTSDLVERLNNYIGSTGKKYKSHYFTILNWYKKDKQEKGVTYGKKYKQG